MRVRANAHFKGAVPGRIYTVDGRDPEVKSKIAKGWFTVLDDAKPTRRRKR